MAIDYDARSARQLFDLGVDFTYRVDLKDLERELTCVGTSDFPGGRMYVTAVWGTLSDEQMMHIVELTAKGLLPHLERFEILGGTITDVGVASIGRLNHLRSLRLLSGDHISDAGVGEALAKLLSIENLELNLEQCTDDAIATGKTYSLLSTIDLCDTQLTDAGIIDLVSRAPQLSSINVSGTQTTERGIEALSRQRPGLEILFPLHGKWEPPRESTSYPSTHG